MTNADTNTAQVVGLASEAVGFFDVARREDGSLYIKRSESAPEWVAPLCFAAHGDFAPEDTRYQWLHEALSVLAHAEEDDVLDDLAHKFADDVTLYTSERVAWLASNGRRAGYVDAAVQDYGMPDDFSTDAVLGLGMYAERREVFTLAVQFLASHDADASFAWAGGVVVRS